MSAPSGIKVPDDLKTAFTNALNDGSDVRALVFVIEGESFKHHTSVSPKSTFKDDIAELPNVLPSPKTPASFAYRLDSKSAGRYEWMMVTFVPDDAGVRAKMLQASSRAGLMKALGASNFKHDWFATSVKDLTPSALTAHLNHLASPAPLSASEAALAEVREAEAMEAKRAALDPEAEARRRKAVVGLGGKFKWGEGVSDALEKAGERSDDGWIVCLEIQASDPGAISLLTSEACTPSQLASKLPPKSPCYTFYSYPTPAPAPSVIPASNNNVSSIPRNTFQASQGGARPVNASSAPIDEPESIEVEGSEKKEGDEDDAASANVEDLSLAESSPAPAAAATSKGKGRVLFIYTCPSGSPIKFRMVYSSGVRGIQQDTKDKIGMEISGKLETSDISDLTESYLQSSLAPSKPTHSSSLPTSTSNTAPFGSNVPAGAQPTPFGGAFGRPRPTPTKLPVRSATQIPLPASEATTPTSGPGDDDGDSKENIRKAFDAFGPRVGGGGAGGFARPRPAGRR